MSDLSELPDLTGKHVAIIATDHFEESELTTPRDQLEAAGADVRIFAPHEGTLQAMEGDVDKTISVRPVAEMVPSPASPLRDDLLPAIERVADAFWKGVTVVPSQSAGATDGLYLRNVGVPVFGVAGIEMQPEDDRSHGLDERVPVRSLYESREFWNALVKRLLGADRGRAAAR